MNEEQEKVDEILNVIIIPIIIICQKEKKTEKKSTMRTFNCSWSSIGRIEGCRVKTKNNELLCPHHYGLKQNGWWDIPLQRNPKSGLSSELSNWCGWTC
jgi:hypothetical protein